MKAFIKGFKEGFKDIFKSFVPIDMKFVGEVIGGILAINIILWSFALIVIFIATR